MLRKVGRCIAQVPPVLVEFTDICEADMTLLRPVTLPCAHPPDWLSLTVGDLPLLENALQIDRPIRPRVSVLSREMAVLSRPHAESEPRLQEFSRIFKQRQKCCWVALALHFALALQGDKRL